MAFVNLSFLRRDKCLVHRGVLRVFFWSDTDASVGFVFHDLHLHLTLSTIYLVHARRDDQNYLAICYCISVFLSNSGVLLTSMRINVSVIHYPTESLRYTAVLPSSLGRAFEACYQY
jgi:hypothetical protein